MRPRRTMTRVRLSTKHRPTRRCLLPAPPLPSSFRPGRLSANTTSTAAAATEAPTSSGSDCRSAIRAPARRVRNLAQTLRALPRAFVRRFGGLEPFRQMVDRLDDEEEDRKGDEQELDERAEHLSVVERVEAFLWVGWVHRGSDADLY